MQRRVRVSESGLDLRTLEIFVSVCDAGSMTRAATRMSTSQPAVSQAIRQLEHTLGTELLDRQARPLAPTGPGEVLLARGRRMLADAVAARDAVRSAGARALPVLRLGLVDSFAMTVGPDLIKELDRDAEEVRVWSGLTRQLGAGLLSRELDILVTAEPLDAPASLRVERILREPFLLVLPHGFAAARGEPDLAALSERLALVRYSLRSVTGLQVERYLKRIRVDAPRRMEFDGSESVLAMVQAGLGWTITTPLCLLQGHADLSRLVLAPLAAPAPRRALFLTTRDDYDAARTDALARRMRRLLRRRLRAAYSRSSWFLREVAYE